jgi:FkbM family methyltransferase
MCQKKKRTLGGGYVSLHSTLSFVLRHPLNRGRSFHAIAKLLRWQISSRIGFPMAVPFVGSTRLLAHRGMTGATANIYCGLGDFEEMGFLLHALRSGDLFFDCGANVGVYTVLASVTGGACVAFEPVPETFEHLRANVAMNGINATIHQVALGAVPGVVPFTPDQGPCNHVVGQDDNSEDTIDVPVRCLDDFWPTYEGQPIDPPVTVLKIDVEGFESEVIQGGAKTVQKASAIIMELLNGQSSNYGLDDWELHERMLALGFRLHRYDPLSRLLTQTDEIVGGNNLYVRNAEMLRERVTTATARRVHGSML